MAADTVKAPRGHAERSARDSGCSRMDGAADAKRGCANRSGFFSHRECEHFPCHAGVAPERFNCLFCYCPLYTLGEACGGDYRYTASGIKSCVDCAIPHDGDVGVQLVQERFAELSSLAAKSPHE